jgi:hypothetical protein
VNSQSMYPTRQHSVSIIRKGPTGVVDLSEEVDVLGVVAFKLGRDPADTETGSHGKVRYHSNSENHGGEPTRQPHSITHVRGTHQWKTLAFFWTRAERTKTPMTPKVKRVKTTHKAV